jgi:inositol transport system ATP-binding protein
MSTMELISMLDIEKDFAGVHALRRASFELRAGEVMALVGENGAGKSTLMKILLGLVQPDSGSIKLAGVPVEFRAPVDALTSGIAMIHQEISLVEGMSVAENVWLGREPRFSRIGFIGQQSRIRATRSLLSRLGFAIDPEAIVETLSIAEMQLVEITRAVSYGSKVIVMDEPTSALTPKEIDLLYNTIRSLSADGVGIVFISHKLDEVFALADRITVMRDGRTIGQYDAAEIDTQHLVSLIAGRELEIAERKRPNHDLGGEALRIDRLTGNGFFDVSFSVRRGEVLGFCGLMGAGRTEIVSGIFGLDPVSGGSIHLNGTTVVIKSPRQAVRLGLGLVTEDRLRSGSIYPFSVMKNSTITVIESFRRLLTIRATPELDAYRTVAAALGIKAGSPDSLIGELSGGNQQKVLISRWLHREPKVLILDEPTRGIDVGAKSEIYALIDQLARRGVAVIVVSSEIPELFAVCDRIAVVRHGRLVAEHDAHETSSEELLSEAFGVQTTQEF